MYCRTIPNHPNANSNGLYPLHRVLLENKLGRLLGKGELAHHIDEERNNNSPENLGLRTRSSHVREHKTIPCMILDCPICEKRFELKPHLYRLRKKRNKHGKVTCSRRCGGLSGLTT